MQDTVALGLKLQVVVLFYRINYPCKASYFGSLILLQYVNLANQLLGTGGAHAKRAQSYALNNLKLLYGSRFGHDLWVAAQRPDNN